MNDILRKEDFENQIEKCLAKLRMNKKNEEDLENLTVEERDKEEIIEAETSELYNKEKEEYDMRRFRATNAPQNAGVTLLKSFSIEHEAGLEEKRQTWLSEIEEYVDENTDDKVARLTT